MKGSVKDTAILKCRQEVCIKRSAALGIEIRPIFAFSLPWCVVQWDCFKFEKTLQDCFQCANLKPQLLLGGVGEGDGLWSDTSN